jgi:hypothetical protein
MNIITDWNRFKYFFASNEQPVIQEVNTYYQTIDIRTFTYFSQLAALSAKNIGGDIGSLTGLASTVNLYVAYCTMVFNYSSSVSGSGEARWDSYISLFPDECQPSIKQMTVDLRNIPKTFSDFLSDGIAGVEYYLDHYPAGKTALLNGFADYLVRKREQLCGGWTGLEISYTGNEQLAMTELSYYLQGLVSYPDFTSLANAAPEDLAAEMRRFNQFYNLPRRFVNFFINDFQKKANTLIASKYPLASVEQAFIKQFRPALQGGVSAFLSTLRSYRIIDSFYDLATIPALTGIDDTLGCTGSETGHELQANGDFSLSSGGWYNSSGVLLTGLNGINSGNTYPYTGHILTVGKTYQVNINVLDTSVAGLLKDSGGSTLYTFTHPGTQTFTFTATTDTIQFDITLFDDVSITEVMGVSCDPVTEYQAAGSSQAQISHLTPQGSVAVDDVYMVRINTKSSVFYKATTTSTADLIAGIISAINAASTQDNWNLVTASNGTSYVIVTANSVNKSFTLEVISLKRTLMGLTSDHMFYYSYAAELIGFAKAAYPKEFQPFEYTGLLVPTPSTANLSGYNIRASFNGGSAGIYGYIGTYVTQANGNFAFTYNLPKPFVRDGYILIELLSNGTVITSYSYYVVHGEHIVNTLSFSASTTTVTYPTIADVASITGLTIPSALSTFLASNGIVTLKDIRTAGGLKYMSGLPVAQDDPAVVALDAHAQLNTISYDIMVNQNLIDEGFTSLADIAGTSRGDMVIKFLNLTTKAGGFNALNIYTVAKAYTAFLQTMISAQLNTSLLATDVGGFPQLDAVLEEKCNCDDCDAAVSPLAYLTDLLNYSDQNLKYSPDTDIHTFLESKFYQDFNNLPTDCKDAEELVCQQRIVVEILRRYITDPAHTPSTPQQNALNTAVADYCRNAYKYLLNLAGTSYEEIRNVRTGTDSASRKSDLASRLNIPYSDSFDPFTTLFRDIKTGASLPPDEAFLEQVFGYKDTTRDVLSTGLKLSDTAAQIYRWGFKGIVWNKNTDAQGYIYLIIDHTVPEVRIYKSSARDSGNLIATATSAGDDRYTLSPENESGLTGELFLSAVTDSTSIYISLVPLFISWQQTYLRSLWIEEEYPADVYIDHTLPVIDPDITGPDDFRQPDVVLNAWFKVWFNRRNFIDNILTADTTTLTTARSFMYAFMHGSGHYAITDMLAVMNTSITYTLWDSSTASHTPWSSVPDFATLTALYTAITGTDTTAYNTAAATITGTYNLSTDSFQRLYELYNGTLTNDGKGFKNTEVLPSGTAQKQLNNLYFTGIERGDIFSIQIGGADTITHTATASDAISNVLSSLATSAGTAGGGWANVTVTVSSDSTYLIIEAHAVNTPFTLTPSVFRALTDDEANELASILAQAVKRTFFTNWISEENLSGLLIHIDSSNFWPPLTEPSSGTWPIPLVTGVPLIDPELINVKDMAEPTVGAAAIAVWYTRTDELQTEFNTIQAIREQQSLDAAYTEAWGSSYLGSYASLTDLLNKLNNLSDPAGVAAATTHIETVLYTTPDAFRQIMAVSAKNTPDSADTISADEWNSVYASLTTSHKQRAFYTTWLSEETSSSFLYWQVYKAKLPSWRASTADRYAWSTSLSRVRRYPVLDPDLIRPDFLASIDSNDPVYILWKSRHTDLNTLFSAISNHTTYPQNLTGFNNLILAYISPSGSALLISLLEDSKLGTDISKRLIQLNLSFDALEFLVNIYYLIQDDVSEVLDGEWNEIYSILLQATKERLFSDWNKTEQTDGLVSGPDEFIVSEYKDQSFFTDDQEHIVRWRMPDDAFRDWIDTLQARSDQMNNIYSFFAGIADSTEEAWMQSLRDALILATDVSGTQLLDKAKAIGDKLLIDAENNCCQQTTRISQAIETIQGIFFSIRNGILQDTYPGLSLTTTSDNFDEEWTWMGSYATWRAAMFVNLYPENLLYPTLRNNQSYGFSTYTDTLRNATTLTPSNVCDAVYTFFLYFEDMCKLTVVASCSGRTLSFNGNSCSDSQNQYRNFVYLFAKGGKTGSIYYSTLDADDTSEYAHGSWVPITAFDPATSYTIMGATKWNKSDSDAFVLLFCTYTKDGVNKIGYAQLNLNTGNWDEDLVEMDIPALSGYDFSSGLITGRVNNVSGDEKVPVVYIAITVQPQLIIQNLNLSADGKSLQNNSNIPALLTNTASKLFSYTNYHIIYEESQEVKTQIYIDVVTYYKQTWNGDPSDSTTDKLVSQTEITADVYYKYVNNPVITYYSRLFASYTTYIAINTQQANGYHVDYKGVVNSVSSNNTSLVTDIDSVESCFGVFPADAQSLFFSCRKLTGEYLLNEFTPAGTIDTTASSDEYLFMNSYEDSSGNLYLIYQLANKANNIMRCLIKPTPSGLQFDATSYVSMGLAVTGPFGLSSTATTSKNADYKTALQTAYLNNSGLPKSESMYLWEAYYFVPMMAALSLQDAGYYQEALDWFRLVYDYSVQSAAVGSNIRPRKIWYGLIAEESAPNNYKRLNNWLNDPINPHALAEIRPNCYTRYTVMSIVQCMQAYGDSLYTQDTSESVPKARLLYEEALELLNEEELVPAEEDCTTSIENLSYTPTSGELADWPEWEPVWNRIVLDLYKVQDKDVLANTITLIQTELAGSDSLADKMSYCRDTLDDALETPEQFENLATLLSTNRITSSDAMLRLLLNPELGQAAEDMGFNLLAAYLNAVSLVSGLPPETLTRPDFYLNWFGDDTHRINDIAYPDTFNQLVPTSLYPLMNTQRDKVYYNYVAPSYEQILTLSIIKNPIRTVNEYFQKTPYYVPQPNISFCVPPNPVLSGILYTAEVSLYKIRNCMNIAGIVRQLDPYAAPTDQSTGIPVINGNGSINLNITQNFQPSQYRYDFLIERAKQQQQIAQQLEATLLSMYERFDAEQFSQLQAKQAVEQANAGVQLQNLQVKEAGDNITLAQLQKDRVTISQQYYTGLVNQNINALEAASLVAMVGSIALFTTAAATVPETALTGFGFASSSLSGFLSQLASYQRRLQDWNYQLSLSNQDLKISDQQIAITQDQYDVTVQQRQIAQLDLTHTQDTLTFLTGKFTNAELYDFMSRTLSKVYAYFLRQATSTALSASNQLAFERQTTVPSYIQSDYWAAPSSGTLSSSGTSSTPDRRGLTGAERLLQDIYQLDQYAVDSDTRKLQLTKTLSLSSIDPVAFQQFRDTGVLNIITPASLFDRDFPGHYLRLVKQVKVSVIALIPPTDGIKASLSNAGISHVINGNTFQRIPVVRTSEKVALTSPLNATGVFELNQQSSTMLNPFESIGVDTSWEFTLPKAANFFDYNTIADVLFSMDYTALESTDYRNTVIKNMSTDTGGVRPFSFKNELSDQWYDLSNPPADSSKGVTVSFDVSSADFPANLNNLVIEGIALYVAVDPDFPNPSIANSKVTLSYFLQSDPKTAAGSGTTGIADNGIISTMSNGNALNWSSMTGKNVNGTWTMLVPDAVISKMKNEEIDDILFVIYYSGETAKWV